MSCQVKGIKISIPQSFFNKYLHVQMTSNAITKNYYKHFGKILQCDHTMLSKIKPEYPTLNSNT